MALIDQATPLLALFLRLSAATGARRGEVCALRWDDVAFGARLVHIHRSVLQLPGKEVLIKDTKTHSERTVSIDAETAARLATRRAEVETALKGGSTIVELPYIFSHDTGERPWRPDYVTAAWRRLCDAAGIVGVRVHDLRHMHASYLLDAGVPLHTCPAASATSALRRRPTSTATPSMREIRAPPNSSARCSTQEPPPSRRVRSEGRQGRALPKAMAAPVRRPSGGATSVSGPSKGLGREKGAEADAAGSGGRKRSPTNRPLASHPLLRAAWRVALEPWRNVMEDRLTLTVGEAAQVLGVSRALAFSSWLVVSSRACGSDAASWCRDGRSRSSSHTPHRRRRRSGAVRAWSVVAPPRPQLQAVGRII